MDIKRRLFYSYSLILFFIIFSIFKISYCNIDNFHYHISTNLNNGNFLVFSCDGTYLIYSNFTPGIFNASISGGNCCENLAHFSYNDGGYILYITSNTHFLFSSDGYFLASYPNDLSKNYHQYSVVPHYHSSYKYYYHLIHYNKTGIIFQNYYYNSNLNIISHINNNFYYVSNDFCSITCELMLIGKSEDVIACFFGTSYTNNNNIIYCIVFNSNYNFIKSNCTRTNINTFYNIKSSIMTSEGRNKVLIVAQILNSNSEESIIYAGYDVNTNSFFKEGIIKDKDNCDMDTGYINLNYFFETQEFIMSYFSNCNSFLNNDKENNILIYSFDKNFKYSFFGIIRDFIFAPLEKNNNNTCSPITINSYNRHTITFSTYTRKYCFIGNINDIEKLSYIIINKDINIYIPIEKNSNKNVSEFACENFTDFNPNSKFFTFLKNSSMNYLPKCTIESPLVSNCNPSIYNIQNKKKFVYSYNCSGKFPYELIEENKCVEYCDHISLSNGTCTLEDGIITLDSTYSIESEEEGTTIVLSQT